MVNTCSPTPLLVGPHSDRSINMSSRIGGEIGLSTVIDDIMLYAGSYSGMPEAWAGLLGKLPI